MGSEKLKIVINKTEQKTEGENVLNVHYVVDGTSNEKVNVALNVNDLTEEEKVVFTKFLMIIERLLKYNGINNIIGI